MQAQTLFRREALEFQRIRHWGEVTLVQPVPARVLSSGVLVASAIALTFLCTAQFARKETVLGYLAPTSGVVRVYAPRSGAIGEVFVKDGQVVAGGEPLLTVMVDQTAAGGTNVDVAVLEALRQQKDLLAERIVTQERLADAERERLETRLRGLEAEAPWLEAQVAGQRERVKIADERIAGSQSLRSSRIISETEHKQRVEAKLELERGLNALLQDRVGRQHERLAARLALEQLPHATAEKIQVLRNELLVTEQRIAEVEGRRAYAVLAPVAGRISTLQGAAGRAADPRLPQLSILPEGDVLHAELFVPTRAAGFVKPGQEVRILYDAFPYQHFGTSAGRVVAVSQTVLTEADVSAPLRPREPAYRVIASLNRQDIHVRDGAAAPLQADMLLRADIVLERRRLLAWLLDPLLRVRLS